MYFSEIKWLDCVKKSFFNIECHFAVGYGMFNYIYQKIKKNSYWYRITIELLIANNKDFHPTVNKGIWFWILLILISNPR
jgi:hypothetical protein